MTKNRIFCRSEFGNPFFFVYLCKRNLRKKIAHFAEIAQLVERNLAKVEVAGPSPVFRSKTDD